MRKIQINVELNLFEDEEPKKLQVYADADNPYEAACAAFQEMLAIFSENGYHLPAQGVSEHHNHFVLPKEE